MISVICFNVMDLPPLKREPSYSATSPRSRADVELYVKERAPEFTGYSLRTPISESDSDRIDNLLSPTSRSGRRLSLSNYKCYSLTTSTRWPYFSVVTLYKSSRDILRDVTILPYELSQSDTELLKSGKYVKGDRFTIAQRYHLLNKLAILANQLNALQHSQCRESRANPLFNLFPGRYVDSFGRHFEIRDNQFVFCHLNLNFGRGTREFTRGSVSISLPIYAWNALAGLSVDAKAAILENKGTDFHHVDENLWDIRPNAVMPIPSFVHRWAHSNSYSLDQYKQFFM